MTVETVLLGQTLRYRSLVARTSDGLDIAIQDYGRSGRGRDILFLHGYAQSNLAWFKQVTGGIAQIHRLVTCDLRGHGGSSKPLEPHHYRDPSLWADEVSAVIETAQLERPIIVAWSYAGRVILDYLAAYGDAALGGLVMVAATSTGQPQMLGPATADLRKLAQSTEVAETIAATSTFIAACTAEPLSGDALAIMLAYNMMVPAAVRAAMVGRPTDYDPVLRSLRVPVLLVHGMLDPINLPGMSAHTARLVPHARHLSYEGTGHMPFWEMADRFDRDLMNFADDDAGHRS